VLVSAPAARPAVGRPDLNLLGPQQVLPKQLQLLLVLLLLPLL
jgi:hypothetical protein